MLKQNKAAAEVEEIVEKYGETLNLEQSKELKYLEAVVTEASRLYPFNVINLRRCTRDWKIPNSNVVIKKGMRVAIPIIGIHMDPDYYEDPEAFRPERFLGSAAPYGTQLAFGMGPRMCMAKKISELELKLFLFLFLRRFVLFPGSKLTNPPQLEVKFPNFLRLFNKLSIPRATLSIRTTFGPAP